MITSQNLNFLWAKHLGGLSEELGRAIAVDANGNVYTTGEFNSTADFNPSDDPNTGTYNMTSLGYQDIFVSKLDASGNFLWAKQLGGVYTDRARAIALDASGNIYITGNFSGTADFDPGPGTYNLTGVGNEDIFVAKLNPSGNLAWARQLGGGNTDIGLSIVVNAIGNVSITGYFRGTADFDPGPAVYNLTAGYIDIFVSTLDASGNFLWAKRMGGGYNPNGNSGSSGNAIALDASGNVYTTGYFSSTGDFDPGTEVYNLIAGNTWDIFVSKLDPSGNFVWAKQLGASQFGSGGGNSIAIDALGNVYTTGLFTNTVDFNPSPFGVYNLTGSQGDIFVSKLDANGDFVWAKQMGGLFGDVGNDLTLDAAGNVYVTGSFWGTGDFDPGPANQNMTSAGEEDIFVTKLDPSGNLAWTARMGGSIEDVGASVAIDNYGNIYTTGYFFSVSADFDPGNGVYSLSPVYAGGFYIYADAFVEKLCQMTNPTVSITGATTICQGDSVVLTSSAANAYLWSNGATTQSITVKTSGNYAVTVSSASGCTAASIVTTVLVNPAPATPTITSNGPTTFCQGGSVMLASSSATSYLWNNGATTPAITVSSSGSYFVTTGNIAGCTATSVSTVVTVNPLPTAIIAPDGPTTFCQGGSVILTANPASAYSWNTGATTQSITVTTTGNYTVTVTTTGNCSAVSAPTTVTVAPTLTPGVGIVASQFSICPGENVTFTANPVNGGAAPVYQWFVDGVAQAGNGPTFSTTTLSNGAPVYCSISSNAACASPTTATSNTISIAVNPSITPSVGISASKFSICAGENVMFTANPTNGGAAPVYQWFVNGLPQPGTGSTFSTTALTNGAQVYCTLNSNATCASPATVASNTIGIAVNPAMPVSVSLAASSTVVCAGDSITFTATPANGGTTPVYQWFMNGVLQPGNGPVFSAAFNNGIPVYCTLTSNATCANPATAPSNTIFIAVNPVLVAGISIAASDTSICTGDPVTFIATTINGGSMPSYQWFINDTLQLPAGPNLTTTTLSNGAQVYCTMTSNALCANPVMSSSNLISVSVTPITTPEVSIVADPAAAFACDTVTFTAIPTNGGTAPAYAWYVNGILQPGNAAIFPVKLESTAQVYCVLTSNANCLDVGITSSSIKTITVTPLPTPEIVLSNDTVYVTNYSGAQYSYTWYFDNSIVSSSPYLVLSDDESGAYYLVVDHNGCTVTSNTVVPTATVDMENYFVVYPNPATSIVWIEGKISANNQLPVMLYNVFGQKIDETTLSPADREFKVQFNLETLPAGMYFVVIGSKVFKQTFKVQKQE